MKEHTEHQLAKGLPAVLLVSQGLRAFIARMVRHGIQGLHVLSYEEIPEDKQIKVVASVGNPAAAADMNGQATPPQGSVPTVNHPV